MISTNPKSYGDLIATLTTWTAGVLLTLTLAAIAVLPKPAAEAVARFAETWPYSQILGPILIAGAGAFILINLLKVHELYDTLVVRWRTPYDNDYILPTLLAPYIHGTDPQFLDMVRQQRRLAMRRLFYRFVQDHEPKIPVNYIVRFYQRMLRYWTTQVNELGLLAFGVYCGVLVLFNFGTSRGVPPLVGLVLAGVLVVAQRVLVVGRFRRSVERATAEEIEAIHEEHVQELEQQILALHEKWGLSYKAN